MQGIPTRIALVFALTGIAAPSSAVQVAAALGGQTAALQPGRDLVYEGRSSYRVAQGAGAFERSQELRVRFVVLAVRADGRVDIARFASRRKKGAEAFGSPALSFVVFDPKSGSLSESKGALGSGPGLPDRVFPTSGARASDALDLRRFGLQPAPVALSLKRERKALDGRVRIQVRSDSKPPIALKTKQASFVVTEHARSFVVDERRGIPLEAQSSTELEVFGMKQRRSWSLRYVDRERAKLDAKARRHLAGFGEALAKIDAQPKEALAAIDAYASNDDLRAVLGVFGPELVAIAQKRGRARLASLRADAARRAKLDAMLGKLAPDFELDSLASGTCSLRDARGKLLLLTFWGVG